MSFTDGSLISLGQDVFKDVAAINRLQIIDLSNNAIDSINVNAFRHLEVFFFFKFFVKFF